MDTSHRVAARPLSGPSPLAGPHTLQTGSSVDELFGHAAGLFHEWEVVKDIVDEMIDLSLNYRQSGHPGGRAPRSTFSLPRSCLERCGGTSCDLGARSRTGSSFPRVIPCP